MDKMSNEERFLKIMEALDKAFEKVINQKKLEQEYSEGAKSDKVAMIGEIMDIRKQMGYEPSVKAFDRLYDLELCDLHQAVLVYKDELYEYNLSRKKSKGKTHK